MILRRRCLTQLSLRISCLNTNCPRHRPPPHHRSLHASRPLCRNGDDEGDIFDRDGPTENPEEEKTLKNLYTGGKKLGTDAKRDERSSTRQRQLDDANSGGVTAFTSITQVDSSLDDEDLGLKFMPRRAKVPFRRWLLQRAPALKDYPQHLVADIEARRIEKLRQASEDRMFARMNVFFNSLSLEEIIAGKLAMKTDKKGRILPNQHRHPQTEPTPFQQVMSGAIVLNLSAKEFESRVLALMSRWSTGLAALYKNYIDWSDYQLQKQRLWFWFGSQGYYRDVVERLWALNGDVAPKDGIEAPMELEGGDEGNLKFDEFGIPLNSDGLEEAFTSVVRGRGGSSDAEATDMTTALDTESETTDIEATSNMETAEAMSANGQPQEADTPSESNQSTILSAEESAFIAEQHTVLSPGDAPKYTVDPMEETVPPTLDLGEYLGPKVSTAVPFPFLGTPPSNYVNPILRHPFPFNEHFRPWRPISHSTGLRMFDAWREGLGLKNIAWMGGVSWRRADAIIGIMKREWRFVAEGGEMEEEMGTYLDKLLAETPDPKRPVPRGGSANRQLVFMPLPPLDKSKAKANVVERRPGRRENDYSVFPKPGQLSAQSEPLASPEIQRVRTSYPISKQRCPFPDQPIWILPQISDSRVMQATFAEPDTRKFRIHYKQLLELKKGTDRRHRDWEAKQKEPIVEIPIRRTKQYFAIAQEMEEYSEKRASQALGGIDGRTMTEKEQGIKLFLQKFGGLRSLGDRHDFQGNPPWNRQYGIRERMLIKRKVKKEKFKKPRERVVDRILKNGKKAAEKGERVIWKFEDVEWVKQRIARPRKRSFVGLLDARVRLESGVRRYGPHGIGSGKVEGVGEIKKVIVRGLDGNVRFANGTRKKPRKRREIVA